MPPEEKLSLRGITGLNHGAETPSSRCLVLCWFRADLAMPRKFFKITFNSAEMGLFQILLAISRVSQPTTLLMRHFGMLTLCFNI